MWISDLCLLTQPSYQIFIFFMITDPKTTTRTWRRQCAVAVLVAAVETLLRLYGGQILVNADVHAPYYALFLVAPITNLIEIWWEARRARKARLAAGALPPPTGDGKGEAALGTPAVAARSSN